MVEYFETIYPKVHRISRGIITQIKQGEPITIYKVVTTENESTWVYEEDLRKLEKEEC